jgi:hypothetical protein
MIEPPLDVEWDMTFYEEEPPVPHTTRYGGDDTDCGEIAQIPCFLVDRVGQREAFERFTRFSAMHSVHWESDASDSHGNEGTREQLKRNTAELHARVREHAKGCAQRAQVSEKIQGKGEFRMVIGQKEASREELLSLLPRGAALNCVWHHATVRYYFYTVFAVLPNRSMRRINALLSDLGLGQHRPERTETPDLLMTPYDARELAEHLGVLLYGESQAILSFLF